MPVAALLLPLPCDRSHRELRGHLVGRLDVVLGHSKRDKVCPRGQSRLFARDMKAKGLDVIYTEDPVLGHNWKLWSGYLGAVFEFFNGKLRVAP